MEDGILPTYIPENISKKNKIFCSREFNRKHLTDEEEIQKRIENKEIYLTGLI